MPPRPRHNSLPSALSLSSRPASQPQKCLLAQARCFSATPSAAARKGEPRPIGPAQRTEFFNWINGPGAVFKQADDGGPKYLSSYDKRTWERKDRMSNLPYPMNPAFKSTPVLSNEMREQIYRRVEIEGASVRKASAEFAVSLERIAAVVRLKAVERKWQNEGKHISSYLTKALEQMLPITHFVPADQGQRQIHENIQELFSHPFAGRQAFVPTSESREFTRVDAGKEFGLPPADEAVPHPELIITKRERNENLSLDELERRQAERDRLAQTQQEEKEARAAEKLKNAGTFVEQGRWKWNLKEARAGSVGFRYGFPHPDRKKGHVKIPTHVI
ncbi:eukaryotic mitochondrial regulator protein-domain-containing protein [Morchella snyderi]|nr:eukaryotic mitochondrial regulator protein-domain-containing protein [Morchella snyderi]